MTELTPKDLVYIEKCKSTDYALDALFDYIDNLLLAGSFGEVDAFLNAIKIEEHSDSVLCGFLAITSHASDKLNNRTALYEKTKSYFKNNNKDRDLIKGLERFK